ncbi:ATP-binding cassette domain-containing protein [Pelosinus sp. UFO1]|uniref:ABC transporter ATP-binding protein n=1 Tax=Pelosinus sp. UFO1 TaxID=484770 RepID=UPI0004D1DF4A|nr:ATP-binding cassette domain-containing protein [Pelosinus sp. UFO1]AIF53878.1 Phosphate-transporting ATPase [Pelosinus sp. UFO1]
MNILQCNNVQLILNKQVILHNISFSVQKGERVGLIGPSGSGKSSLFRLLNLLFSPIQGEVLYKNKNIQDYAPTELRRSISYILQKPYLFGTSVQENLFYPYQLLNQEPNLDEIFNYLSKANLPKNILEKKNTALSGGEQQRIALIRSLLMKPEIILLDEITAALDEENTLLIEKLLIHEQQAHNTTLLFITHNISQAKRLAQKILYLEAGTIRFFGASIDFFSQKGEAYE